MGCDFADQYSLLHFCVGSISYFWNIPLWFGFLVHFIFEIVENTNYGVYFINKYIIDPGYFSWPGLKHSPDSVANITGDNVFYVIGWLVSYFLDDYGKKHKWHTAQ